MMFKQLPDGSLAEIRDDGTLVPIVGQTDWAKVASWTDEEIEEMAASDADHPPLDDEFWDQVGRASRVEAVRVEADVLDFFKRSGPSYEAKINAVLREHVAAELKRTGS